MKKEYITDYKSFISDWRERYIEVSKDVRKGKDKIKYNIFQKKIRDT